MFLGGPPGWTADDRDKALAWQELQRQTCGTCGTRAEEWDPEQGGSTSAWVFEPTVCRGCEHKERTEAAMSTGDWQDQRGKRVRARRPKKT